MDHMAALIINFMICMIVNVLVCQYDCMKVCVRMHKQSVVVLSARWDVSLNAVDKATLSDCIAYNRVKPTSLRELPDWSARANVHGS